MAEQSPGALAAPVDFIRAIVDEDLASGKHHGRSAGQQDSGNGQAGLSVRQCEAEDRDVVEVIAHLADHLPGPRESVIPIEPQQSEKTTR